MTYKGQCFAHSQYVRKQGIKAQTNTTCRPLVLGVHSGKTNA